jgi:hypothetical protein
MWKPTQVGMQPLPGNTQRPEGAVQMTPGNAQPRMNPPTQAGVQHTQTSMTTYIDAVDRFSKAATAFMQHVDLLTEARSAYQQAMTASAELRNVLNAGDETLRNFMTQLEQSVSDHLGRPNPERKKPDKVEVIKASSENMAVAKVEP